jgi:hypothetical protein
VCEHNSGKQFYCHFRGGVREAFRKGNDIARAKLRKRWIDGSATSKPESLLHKLQKDSAPPRVSIVHGFTSVPRGKVRTRHPQI